MKRTAILSKLPFFCGGEEGIRTLDALMRHTRFPIVRARPTTRLLRVCRKQKDILFCSKPEHYNAEAVESQEVIFRNFRSQGTAARRQANDDA